MTAKLADSCAVFFALAALCLASSSFAQQSDSAGPDDALWQVLENVRPAVVTLRGYGANNSLRYIGSGFMVSDNGLIVTNLKLLDGIVRVEMQTMDNTSEDLDLVALTNRNWGVALLRSATQFASPLRAGTDRPPRVGDDIIAIGSPKGVNVTLSEGKIESRLSHLGTNELLQISNDFSPGMNGGPVLNLDGEVIGMLTSIVREGRPVHLTIPIEIVQSLVNVAGKKSNEQDLKQVRERVAQLTKEMDEMRRGLETKCSSDDLSLIDSVIGNAIRSGAVVYNKGDPLACFRIYEGASYQMLYRLKDRCKTASRFLEKALFEAATTKDSGQYGTIPAAQAWIMRNAFDSLTGARNNIPASPDAQDNTADTQQTGT